MPGYVCKMKKQRNGAGVKLPFSEGCDRVITTTMYYYWGKCVEIFFNVFDKFINEWYLVRALLNIYNTVDNYVTRQKTFSVVYNIFDNTYCKIIIILACLIYISD